MSSKIINFVTVCLFSLCMAGNANAGLILNAIYEDAAGVEWQYVGSFDLTDGPDIKSNGMINHVELVNGIDVAELKFGLLSEGVYALSTFLESDILSNANGYGVNHQAWYDAFLDFSQFDPLNPPTEGGIKSLAENRSTLEKNTDGTPSDNAYDELDDRTAFVDDHGVTGNHINYVFKSVSTPVPEPSTLAIFSLALIGLASRRFKK